MKKKIYCFINGGFGRLGGSVAALAEDGEGIAGHFSSNESWAKHDIGINSTWKHEIYQKKYPEGYELIWIDSNNDSDEGFLNALKLNELQPQS
jgi:hypothetical protein